MVDSSQKKFFFVFLFVVILFVGYWLFDALYSRGVASPHEILSASSSSPFFGDALTGGQVGFIPSGFSSNLTQEAITDISKDIIASLQGASSTSQEDLLNQLQQSGLNSLSPETLNAYATPDTLGLIQEIPDSEISLSSDSSASAVTTYKQAYTDAIKPLAQLISESDVQKTLNSFVKDNDTQDLDRFIQTYDTVYNALRSVPVPQSAVALHKESMRFFANEKVIFMGVRGYKEDPLRAYLLGEQLTQLSDVWQNILTQYNSL